MEALGEALRPLVAWLAGVAFALFPSPARSEADAQDRFPKAAAAYLVAIDGRTVWARQPDQSRAPASLTKIMTAIVLLEGDWKADAAVTVSRRAAAATGSRAGLREGETVSAGELLTAMLVSSANDACLALAEHAAGNAAAFVAAMNARAAAMDLRATHFENPCGHDAPDQRSSARDLLVMTERALTHPEFARIVALDTARLTTARGRRISVKTGNHLLGHSAGVAGVKTGFTPGAGKCLVVLARRGETRVVIVLLNAVDRWWTAAALVEEAFDAARAQQF